MKLSYFKQPKRLAKAIWIWFWLRALKFTIRRCRPWRTFSCANRHTRTMTFGEHLEITIIYRNISEPDGYTREELVKMLRTVRKHEKQQGWHVPEPITPDPLLVDYEAWINAITDVDPVKR